jgi:hypothetical protein
MLAPTMPSTSPTQQSSRALARHPLARGGSARRLLALATLAFLLASILPLAAAPKPALGSHTANPTAVGIPGSYQSEVGCPGDWQPECATTHLTYDAADDVWQGSWSVPAGTWEYKAALNNTWDENYGVGGQNGGNLALSVGSTVVKFYYDHKSHWVTSNQNAVIAVAPGSFQSELGCPGDWQPDCLRSWLQDPDGDGIYTFTTRSLPAGSYEVKVAIDESWTENYGAGGARAGDQLAGKVPSSVAG